jgi:hypothetical protein
MSGVDIVISRLNVKLLSKYVTLLIVGLLVAACVAPDEGDETQAETPARTPTSQSSPLSSPLRMSPLPAPSQETGTEQDKAVTAAVQALSDELKIATDEIQVVSVESVQFSDSSLGCPEEGMVYLQVITPGYQVLLRVEGETYDYRVSEQRVVLCPAGQ